MCGVLLSFLEAIAVAGQGEDLRAMHETVNEGDDAGRVGKTWFHSSKGLLVVKTTECRFPPASRNAGSYRAGRSACIGPMPSPRH